MIKVLIVAPSLPYPEYKDGLAKINYNLLKRGAGYKADLLTVDEGESGDFSGIEIHTVPQLRKLSKMMILSKWLTSSLPLNIIRYDRYTRRMANRLERIHFDYDVIHISSPFFAPIFSMVSRAVQEKMLLFPVDSISLNIERRVKKEKNLIKKLILHIDSIKYRRFEATHYPKYKKVVFVSDIDAEHMKKLNSAIETVTISNGVDIDFFKESKEVEHRDCSIVFTGDMSYPPNEDAIKFFIEKVYPLINERMKLKLYVVGKRVKPSLSKLATKDIIFTGFVPDIREYISKACLYVSPLRFGSGIKNKVLEAMSMSKIVVGTAVSFEGIDVVDGKNCIVVSQDPKEMADRILEVLLDINRYRSIEKEARVLIESRYSWDTVVKRYNLLYRSVFDDRQEG